MDILSSYVPMDRRFAVARGLALPDRSVGAALFADISGFTPLTEALTRALGPRRGAEELTLHLNSVYDALIEQVDRFGGSVIAFAGDAITCWFDGDEGLRATTTALAMQAAMSRFASLRLADGNIATLAMKAGVAHGPARRFVVGAPEVQEMEVLAGETLSRMAGAAHYAARGEVLVDAALVPALGEGVDIAHWRGDEAGGERYAVIRALSAPAAPAPWPAPPELPEAFLRQRLLKPVCERLLGGHGEFLTELRPCVALFLKFDGVDYDGDDAAGAKLNAYANWVQQVVTRYEGFLLDVATGDKGSYLYCSFGAPVAHENDAWRSLSVAHELRQPPPDLAFITRTQIGMSRGTVRTGAYGGVTRRTYGVLGDEVNLSARLMEHAKPGEVLASETLRSDSRDAFRWETRPPLKAKGKSEPVTVHALLGPRSTPASGLIEPTYALPMVGRAKELLLAEQKLIAALFGYGQVLAISAEAGLGKSRLVAEVLRQTLHAEVRCVGGQCQSYGGNTSYLAWWSVWRALFELDAEASPAEQAAAVESKLRQMDPALLPRLPLLGAALNLPLPDNEVTAPLDAKLRKASLEALLADCLRHLAGRRTLMIVIEDAHWMDALSLDLLDFLARTLARLPVLLIVTHRPVDATQLASQTFRELPNFTSLALATFTAAEARRLAGLKVAQLFDSENPPPPSLVDRLIARAEGNPFYLDELLNFLRDQRVNFSDPQALERIEMPASLHTLILSRIDRLTESQKTVVKVASVVGRMFSSAAIRGANPQLGDAQTTADLQALQAADLTALERPEPELAYLFKHIVAQEVAYESLPFATRARLHEAIGLFLEQQHRDQIDQQLDLLAFHFDRSTNEAKKREYLLRAGEAAQNRYANGPAISYYERALPVLDDAERSGVMLRLGRVWELLGEWKKAGAMYQQSFETAAKLGDRQGMARCQAATGDLCRKQGLFADAVNWLDLARDQFREIGDQAGVGQTLHTAGTVAAMQGDYPTAQGFYEQSLALRQQLGDRPQTASLLSNLGILSRFQGNLATSRTLTEQSLVIRREIGDRWAIANSLNNLGVVLRDLGEQAEARTMLEESLAVNRQVGDRWAIANALTSLAEVALDQKDLDAARGFLEESLRANRELGDRAAIAFILETFATLAALKDHSGRALKLAGAARALREAAGAPLSPAEQAKLDESLKSARQSASEAEAADWFSQGQSMNLDAAIAFTLHDNGC